VPATPATVAVAVPATAATIAVAVSATAATVAVAVPATAATVAVTVPATAATVAVTAATVPVGQLHVLDLTRSRLWHGRGVGNAGQSESRKAKRTSDCTRTHNLLQGHSDPLLHVKLFNWNIRSSHTRPTLDSQAMNQL
jgi:hypothetical protein